MHFVALAAFVLMFVAFVILPKRFLQRGEED
jgi:hypothetical protein